MALESPVTILFNTEGNELAVSESQTVTNTQPGLVVFGSGSTGYEFLRLSDQGALFVTGGNISFDANTPVSQGLPGGISDAWYIRITDGTQVLGAGSSAPFFVSGTVVVDNLKFNSNGDALFTAISGVGIDGNALQVTGSVTVNSIASPVTTRPISCPTTVVTGFSASTTNVTVLDANSARCGATFFMDGNATAFVKLGISASSTDYTVKIGNNGFFELPVRYTGRVDVIFDSTLLGAVLRITEISE